MFVRHNWVAWHAEQSKWYQMLKQITLAQPQNQRRFKSKHNDRRRHIDNYRANIVSAKRIVRHHHNHHQNWPQDMRRRTRALLKLLTRRVASINLGPGRDLHGRYQRNPTPTTSTSSLKHFWAKNKRKRALKDYKFVRLPWQAAASKFMLI